MRHLIFLFPFTQRIDFPHMASVLVLMIALGFRRPLQLVHPNYPGFSLVPVYAFFSQTMAKVAGVRGHQMNLVIGVLRSGEAWYDLKSQGD